LVTNSDEGIEASFAEDQTSDDLEGNVSPVNSTFAQQPVGKAGNLIVNEAGDGSNDSTNNHISNTTIEFSSTKKADNTGDEWDERAQVNTEEVIDNIDNDVKESVKISFAEKTTNKAGKTSDDITNSLLDDSGQQGADNITRQNFSFANGTKDGGDEWDERGQIDVENVAKKTKNSSNNTRQISSTDLGENASNDWEKLVDDLTKVDLTQQLVENRNSQINKSLSVSFAKQSSDLIKNGSEVKIIEELLQLRWEEINDDLEDVQDFLVFRRDGGRVGVENAQRQE